MPEDNYTAKYVINILAEQANLNLKYGPLFADQPNRSKTITERKKKDSEIHTQRKINQSQTNEISENEKHVNEIEQKKITTSRQSEISIPKFNKPSDKTENDKMDRENFYHWGATREILDIIRRRNNSPETRRLVEQRNTLSRPRTLRRRYDHQTQRTIFAPSRPNKRSREEIAEIDAELIRRADRIGGGYQPIEIEEEQAEPEELREDGEIEQAAETEEDSVIMRGDNLPIVDLSKYNTDGKEAKYIQINHIVGKLTTNKKKLLKITSRKQNSKS